MNCLMTLFKQRIFNAKWAVFSIRLLIKDSSITDKLLDRMLIFECLVWKLVFTVVYLKKLFFKIFPLTFANVLCTTKISEWVYELFGRINVENCIAIGYCFFLQHIVKWDYLNVYFSLWLNLHYINIFLSLLWFQRP